MTQESNVQPKARQLRLQEAFALVGGFGLFAWLLATIITDSPVHPVFAFAALVFFLYPFRRQIVARRVMQLGVLVFIFWMLISLSGVLAPFIIAFVLAYLTEPIIRWATKFRLPRWIASLILVLTVVGLVVTLALFVAPKVASQIELLATSAQSLFKDANSFLDARSLARMLEDNGVPPKQAQELVKQVQPQLKAMVTWLIGGMGQMLQNVALIVESLFNIVLIPMIWFYLLMDFDRLKAGLKSALNRINPRALHYAREIDVIFISYLRGISITSSIVGVLATAAYSIVGLPYAIILGILTGVFNLIPSVGIFLNLAVAIIIFLFSPGSFWYNTLVISITITVLHMLNAYVVEPRVLGDRVGLHPVVLIASLFIFAYFLGFIGLLIAVPTTAVIIRFLQEWFNRIFPRAQPATAEATNTKGIP